jgi:DNA gyrase/topoisomerase IV subunit A
VRLQVVSSEEELLLAFSSGRIFTLPVQEISTAALSADGSFSWRQAALPDEPRATETLASLLPISRLALADSFVQASRRGFIKKIKAALGQSILANHYIGTSTKQPADRSFEIILCDKDARLILVSQEGYLAALEVKNLPYSIEEAMRLGTTDHLEAAFALQPEHSVLIVTQAGKLIHRAAENLAPVTALKARGDAVFSAQRRAQGVRVVAAGSVSQEHWAAALHQDGLVSLHSVSSLIGAGVIPTKTSLVAVTFFAHPGKGG